MMPIDLTTLTDQELNDLAVQVAAEKDKRILIASAGDQIDHILSRVQEAMGFQAGDPWVQPTGAHDSYPIGVTVTHGGKEWINLTTANVWEPGVANWREVPATPGTFPEWVQPTGSHDAYPISAKVTHAGKNWRSTIAANVWEPGTVGTEALWVVIP